MRAQNCRPDILSEVPRLTANPSNRSTIHVVTVADSSRRSAVMSELRFLAANVPDLPENLVRTWWTLAENLDDRALLRSLTSRGDLPPDLRNSASFSTVVNPTPSRLKELPTASPLGRNPWPHKVTFSGDKDSLNSYMYRLVTKPGGFTNVDAPLSEEQAVELLCETAQSFSRRKARKVLRSYERRADPLFISMCHLVAARYGVHSRRAHKAFLRVAGNYEDAARALMYKYSDPVTAYYNRGVDPLTFHLTFERMRALFTSGMMSNEMLSELPLVWLFPFTSDRRLSPEEARVALRPLYDADVRTWSLVLDLATSDPSLPLMAPILVY